MSDPRRQQCLGPPRLRVRLALCLFVFGMSVLTPPADAGGSCRYMKSRSGLAEYEAGGPFLTDHFRLTKGRTDLRDFLWRHWHEHKLGVAEEKGGTVDRGTVTVLYIVHPDKKGNWGIDMEMDRPLDPPCVAFHADSLVRLPIKNPDEDYPSQTLGLWPPDKVPDRHLDDSIVEDPKLYRVLLVRDNKPATDLI